MPIIVAVKYRLKPAKRRELLSFAANNVAATRREPGNLAYSHYPSLDDAQEMFVFELWQDRENGRSHPHAALRGFCQQAHAHLGVVGSADLREAACRRGE